MKLTKLGSAIALLGALLASNGARGGSLFSLEGFHLGMSLEQATAVRPDVEWDEDELPLGLHFMSKYFDAQHLGRQGQVQIQLGRDNKAVVAIAVYFRARTTSVCAANAKDTLARLDALYGRQSKRDRLLPGTSAWRTKTGLEISLTDNCDGAGHLYWVSYSDS